MERKDIIRKSACGFLLIFYMVGRLGLGSERYSHTFQALIPLNLILSACFAFAYEERKNFSFLLRCALIFVAGWLIEWLGVHTGFIFGHYQYGNGLGFKIQRIPLLIGLNWLLLIYSVSCLLAPLKMNWLANGI